MASAWDRTPPSKIIFKPLRKLQAGAAFNLTEAITMKVYLLSLGAGLLVGVIYSLLNVRSPAPPVVALVGLLGILVGEQIIPLAKNLWSKEPAAVSWLNQIKPHVFGHMPKGTDHIELARRAEANAEQPG